MCFEELCGSKPRTAHYVCSCMHKRHNKGHNSTKHDHNNDNNNNTNNMYYYYTVSVGIPTVTATMVKVITTVLLLL